MLLIAFALFSFFFALHLLPRVRQHGASHLPRTDRKPPSLIQNRRLSQRTPVTDCLYCLPCQPFPCPDCGWKTTSNVIWNLPSVKRTRKYIVPPCCLRVLANGSLLWVTVTLPHIIHVIVCCALRSPVPFWRLALCAQGPP